MRNCNVNNCDEPGIIDNCCYDHAIICRSCQDNPAHPEVGLCAECLEEAKNENNKTSDNNGFDRP